MWISRAEYERLTGEQRRVAQDVFHVMGVNSRLEIENARLRSDIDWFKLRLNQVEKERAQLILAATGTPISHPTFTPAQEDPEKALQEMPEFAIIGNDAPEDYSMMPKRAGN